MTYLSWSGLKQAPLLLKNSALVFSISQSQSLLPKHSSHVQVERELNNPSRDPTLSLVWFSSKANKVSMLNPSERHHLSLAHQ